MAKAGMPEGSYHDKFKTVGALRAAAFQLSEALNGTELKPLARDLHDSICRFLPGPPNTSAEEVRFMMGEK